LWLVFHQTCKRRGSPEQQKRMRMSRKMRREGKRELIRASPAGAAAGPGAALSSLSTCVCSFPEENSFIGSPREEALWSLRAGDSLGGSSLFLDSPLWHFFGSFNRAPRQRVSAVTISLPSLSCLISRPSPIFSSALLLLLGSCGGTRFFSSPSHNLP
jgi:hypothetical protein